MLDKQMHESLPVKLTPQELLDHGHDIAGLIESRDTIKGKAKVEASEAKAAIESLDEQIAYHASTIRRGTEDRLVEVIESRDFAEKTVTVIRTDTATAVRTRAMREDELNKPLPFGRAEGEESEA